MNMIWVRKKLFTWDENGQKLMKRKQNLWGKFIVYIQKKSYKENEELRRTQITKTKQKHIYKPKLIIPHNSNEKNNHTIIYKSFQNHSITKLKWKQKQKK